MTVTPLRYGRVGVSSHASMLVFNSGDFVCKDDVYAGYVIDNGSTPCPIGESIGVGVGDPSSPLQHNEHLVDLVPEASAAVSGYWASGPAQGSVTIGSANTEYVYGLVIPTAVVCGHIVLDVSMRDTNSSDLYSVGIFNASGTLIAHISPQAFTTNGVQSPIAFAEGTVTLPPGKYYLGLTGEATVLALASVATTLIPLGATSEGSTSGGAQISSFSPPSDSWIATTGSEPVIAVAP